jgi:hypothetical protein
VPAPWDRGGTRSALSRELGADIVPAMPFRLFVTAVLLRCRVSAAVVTAALIGTAALAPATALAAPDWTPSQQVLTSTGPFAGASLGFADGGQALATQLEVFGLPPAALQTRIRVLHRATGAAWTPELTIDSTATAIPGTTPELAVAPNGAAVIAWQELTGPAIGGPSRTRAAYRAPAGSWEAPVTMATVAGGATTNLVVAIAPNGTAAVLLEHPDPADSANQQVDAITHGPGGWSSVQRLSPAGQSAEYPTVAFDDAGTATAAWSQRFASTRYTIISRRRSASTGLWNAVEDITGSDITKSYNRPRLGVGADGRAVVAFQSSLSPIDVFAATRGSGTSAWSPASRVVTSGTASSSPLAAGVAPDGASYILYKFQGLGSNQDGVGLLRAPSGGSWSAHARISSAGFTASQGGLAFRGADALAAWNTDDSIEGTRWAAGAPAPEVFRTLAATNQGPTQVISDRDGSVVVAFTPSAGTSDALAFDGGAPRLTGANVPASATAGTPTAMSAAFADAWSPLAAGPTWEFGDGATATGPAVSHTYSTPGSYTVTVHSADALGNDRAQTFGIAVSAASDSVRPRVTLALPVCRKKLSKAACKRLRATRGAWRTLRGAVSDPAPSSGIARVEVTAYRKAGSSFLALSGKRFRTVKTRAAAERSVTRVSPKGGAWSLRLPALSKGTWTFRVQAVDRAGHVSRAAVRTVRLG